MPTPATTTVPVIVRGYVTRCAAHPGTLLAHVGAPCECFRGGPAPTFQVPTPRTGR